jgi:hypothetical protein
MLTAPSAITTSRLCSAGSARSSFHLGRAIPGGSQRRELIDHAVPCRSGTGRTWQGPIGRGRPAQSLEPRGFQVLGHLVSRSPRHLDPEGVARLGGSRPSRPPGRSPNSRQAQDTARVHRIRTQWAADSQRGHAPQPRPEDAPRPAGLGSLQRPDRSGHLVTGVEVSRDALRSDYLEAAIPCFKLRQPALAGRVILSGVPARRRPTGSRLAGRARTQGGIALPVREGRAAACTRDTRWFLT